MSVTTIGGNVAVMNIVQATWDIPSVAANTTEEETFTLAGVKVGDYVHVSKADLDAGIVFGSARVTADDTIGVQITNPTGSPVNAAEETVTVFMGRPEGVPSLQTKITT
jgi:ABC-type Co2+ transport system permease subunit